MLPAYDGGSVANLAATALQGMHADSWRTFGLLPPISAALLPTDVFENARVVMLLVIDGLGSEALNQAISRGDVPGLASAAIRTDLTSVFPSTTAAATTSIQYGVAPGTHGMAGYTLFLPEIDNLLNMITWRTPGYHGQPPDPPAPETFLTGPHVFELFDHAGIDSVIVSDIAYTTSPLTRSQADGVRYRGYRTLAEFSHRLLREVERPGRRFVFGYWSGYDELAHSWNTDSEVVRLELRLIDQTLREGLLAPLQDRSESITLLVTADHGHTPMPPDQRVDLAQIPGLLSALQHRPTGEPRQMGLKFVESGGRTINELQEQLGAGPLVVDLAEAIAAGLYGPAPHHAELAARTGDVLLLAQQASAVNFPGGISGSVSGHGSLTRAEMHVPLLAWRFR